MKRISPVQAGVPGVGTSVIDSVLESGLNEVFAESRQVRFITRLALLEYTFGMIRAVDFDAVIKTVTETKGAGRDIRTTLANNGYVLCNVKLYIYALVCHAGVKRTTYEVGEKDSAIVKHCLRNSPKFLAFLRKLKRKGYKAWSLADMRSTIDNILVSSTFKVWMRKFIYRKLRFVYESMSSEPGDMEQEFCTVATYAIFKQYPKVLTPLHAMNIAKTTVHNRGQNIIKDATTQSRGRLTRNADGTFSSRMVPLHSIPAAVWSSDDQEGVTAQTSFTALVVGIDGSDKSQTPSGNERNMAMSMTFRHLYGDCTEPEQRLLELWMGEYDEGLSQYLDTNNADLAEISMQNTAMRMKYLRQCAEYLKLEPDEVNRFYKKLRSELMVFKEGA